MSASSPNRRHVGSEQLFRAGNVKTKTNTRGVEELELMDDVTTVDQHRDERAKVESWRLHVLMEAGYPLPLAEQIARSSADLHDAVTLVAERGCRPETAAEILL